MLLLLAASSGMLCACTENFHSPVNESEVAVFQTNWREKIPARQTTSNQDGMHTREIATVYPVKFAWQGTHGPYKLEISMDENFSSPRVVASAVPEVEVYRIHGCNLSGMHTVLVGCLLPGRNLFAPIHLEHSHF